MEVADERAVATVDSSDDDEPIDVRAIEGASFDLRGLAEDATQTSTKSMHFYRDVAATVSIVASFLFAGVVDKAIIDQTRTGDYGARSAALWWLQLKIAVCVHAVTATFDFLIDRLPLQVPTKKNLGSPLFTLAGWLYLSLAYTTVGDLVPYTDGDPVTWAYALELVGCSAALTLMVAFLALLLAERDEYGTVESDLNKFVGHVITMGQTASTLPVAGLWHDAARVCLWCAWKGLGLPRNETGVGRLLIHAAVELALAVLIEGLARYGLALGALVLKIRGEGEPSSCLTKRFAALRRKTLVFIVAWSVYDIPTFYVDKGLPPRNSRLGVANAALILVPIFVVALALSLASNAPPLVRAKGLPEIVVAIFLGALGPQLGWAIKDGYCERVDLYDGNRTVYLLINWIVAAVCCLVGLGVVALLLHRRNKADKPPPPVDVELAPQQTERGGLTRE